MKVIVFGGSGFLGSHTADYLTESGHEVIIYDKVSSPYLKKTQNMVIGDILDENKVLESVKGCDIVYNFAGIADIDESSKHPLDAVKNNILGTTIILEACRKNNIKRFLFASTLYVYSKAGSFYRSTKQACELLIENYNEIFGIPYTIMRYGSLYGPRSNEKNYITKVIKDALTKGVIVREGDGEEIREYIHVYDAARGSVDVLSEEYKNQYVIITGNQGMKVKDLLFMIKEILDNKVDIQFRPPTQSYHYEITPYTFAPKMARKIVLDSYLDLGQGLLKAIQSMYKELNPPITLDGSVINNEKNK